MGFLFIPWKESNYNNLVLLNIFKELLVFKFDYKKNFNLKDPKHYVGSFINDVKGIEEMFKFSVIKFENLHQCIKD